MYFLTVHYIRTLYKDITFFQTTPVLNQTNIFYMVAESTGRIRIEVKKCAGTGPRNCSVKDFLTSTLR